MVLDGIELDALTELSNIGVSRAASALRKMVGEQVFLSVPAVEVLDHDVAIGRISERESDGVIAVKQAFAGGFSGRALLVFPEASCSRLVRLVTGNLLLADEGPGIEDEAFAEIGNILLTSCLASLSNMLGQQLQLAVPTVLRGSGVLLAELRGNLNDSTVLFLYINFSLQQRDVRGYIALLMDVTSLSALRAIIRDFIEKTLS